MDFRRSRLRLVFAAVILQGAWGTVRAQTAMPATYDVSTVRAAGPGEVGMMLNWRNGELKAQNVSLAWLMTSAFHARSDQISGEPSWAKEKRFDITAKLTDTDRATVEKMTPEQHRALLLALLVERFGLKYHVETKEMPIYDLVPAKSGLKLTAATDSATKAEGWKGSAAAAAIGATMK